VATGFTYPNEIDRIINKPGGDVGRKIRAIALEIADEASRVTSATLGRVPGDAPRTGMLAKSYAVTVIPGTNTFLVRNTRKYSAAMEFGAQKHEIRARRTTYLQFYGRDGRLHRVKIVKHPGSVAHNILRDAGVTVLTRRLGTFTQG